MVSSDVQVTCNWDDCWFIPCKSHLVKCGASWLIMSMPALNQNLVVYIPGLSN